MRKPLSSSRIILGFIATGWFCSAPCEAGTHGMPPDQACEAEMIRAARTHDIPLAMLYAVGLTETGRRGTLSPFAMNIDGVAVYPNTLDEAVRKFSQSNQEGAKFIDIGCMQINFKFHGRKFSSVGQMFEPARNVDYAARFLKTLRHASPSWTLAVARYHAGPNNDPAQRRYVCAVVANMVAAGFGAWTSNAEAFCSSGAEQKSLSK